MPFIHFGNINANVNWCSKQEILQTSLRAHEIMVLILIQQEIHITRREYMNNYNYLIIGVYLTFQRIGHDPFQIIDFQKLLRNNSLKQICSHFLENTGV